MRSPSVWCILAAVILTPHAQAQEAVAKSKIVSVGLFKNGLAVVKREVQIPKEGTYRLDASPEPIHGSFWIESTGKVEAAVKMRDVEVPLHAEGGMRLQHDLAGKKVTLTFRNDKLGSVTGTLVKLAKPELPEGAKITDDSSQYYARVYGSAPAENFLILKTAKGRMYVNPHDVMMIQTDDPDEKVIQRKPVLVLTVEKAAKKPAVFVTYLTSGLAWAPSYHVDITNPKSLAIEMATVVRNEMADLEDAEIKLISGFPSVEFANVTSPLSAHTTWTKFFHEITTGSRAPSSHDLMNQRLANTTNFDYSSRPKLDLGAIPAGEGVDLHFESIGKRTLGSDEALSLTVGKAKADYERVIEWTVGTSTIARRYAGGREQHKDEMWDVLLFKNPFQFPMTTAPAMVVENGRFNGQRTAYWTNIGEEAVLKVTRSLSIRAVSREQEDSKANERVVVDDKNYTKIYLKGELTMSNHRKQPVKMHVRHSIRGVVSEIDGSPKVTTREESLEDVNRVHEVVWTVTLNPGEEKRVTYKNSVLVYR
ncbi:MAG: hypothetical protein HY289_15765 [Planctomycetes bacterium]|nr:hypothetical protein [Planctomycetota bacterium]